MIHVKTLEDVQAALMAFKPVRFASRLQRPQLMPELMDFLGNPQEQYKVVHVAGTSGKTSTAYYAAALLQAAGRRVGLNISPHAESIAERVQIGLQPLPESEFCAEFEQFLQLLHSSGLQPNYFQAITAFAFWEFARQKVEYAVVEVGIGGLADSTNVITREDKICVITDIGYGHTEVLGESLHEIAAHKAGIIQLHNTVFCRAQAEEILAPIRERAKAKQADLHIVHTASTFDFLPPFQQRNFAMAEAAVRYVLERGGRLTNENLETAAHTQIPARLEVHPAGSKTIILDGAHNPQKMSALAESVRQRYPGQKVAVLFGAKTAPQSAYEEMLQEVASLADYVLLTSFRPVAHIHPADPAALLAWLLAADGHGDVMASPEKAFAALQKRPEPVLLVTGSFYLLNHIRPLLGRVKTTATDASK